MVLYSISNTYDSDLGGFSREVVIDDFISAVWTERFIEAGEVELVLPAEHKYLKLLRPGNLLGCEGSREIMLLETRKIENGLATATGRTIEAFFNERYIPGSSVIGVITMAGRGGDILKGIVNYMQDWLVDRQNSWGPHISESNLKIRGLFVDDPDPAETDPIRTITVPTGPVYDTLVSLAKRYKIGQSVIWTKILGGNHKLVYTTYQGRYLGSTIQLSSKLDNLANPKELLSEAGFINFALAVPPEWIYKDRTVIDYVGNPFQWEIKSQPSAYQNSAGRDLVFGPRYKEVDCTDLTLDKLGGPSSSTIPADYIPTLNKMFGIINARLRKALEENKRKKMIDGEVVPQIPFVYKRDYDLGDTVLIKGDFGDPLTAVITEYVRSQDETGERFYPTVSADYDEIYNTGTPDPITA